ncbi:MAG: hypothetical protein Q4D29_11260, partial [Lachnospiraceae bacterium]|nr:hypothetical protein [Lachnospiraceae bacterium]
MSSVIVVSSLYNLMQAIQIRNTILKDESVDLVLCSSQDKIEQIYNNGYLEHVFCNVYLLKKTHYYMSYNRIEKIISFISPAYELKRMLNTRIIPRWNKVYMWNPVGFTYFYYRYNKIRHLSCHYYLYADSAGGYEKSKVDINSPYHSKV